MGANDTPGPGGTPRTAIRRLPERAVHERQSLYAVLDAGLLAHVAVVDADQPYALPVGYARDGDRVLLHGSTGSRLFRALADGGAACVTVTLLDGLVLARSMFESSMNYRSVMVLGRGSAVTGPGKLAALRRLSDHLLPGRWEEARPPTTRELAATLVIALGLEECSVKVRTGGPEDPEEDLDWPVWAGVVPLERRLGRPEPAADLRVDRPPPGYLESWSAAEA